MVNYLEKNAPIIVMEFLNNERGNDGHLKSDKLLTELNFKSYQILNTGELKEIENPNNYLKANHMDSDNIVYKK